jgi:hypothetical protein
MEAEQLEDYLILDKLHLPMLGSGPTPHREAIDKSGNRQLQLLKCPAC